MTKIYVIPIVPITKKNSQRIVNVKGRPIIIPSKAYKDYEKACKPYLTHSEEPINYPVNVECVYSMPTRRKVDLVNLEEATLDVLVKYGVLADDNSRIVVGMDGSRVRYNKENPGVIVTIRSLDDEEIL